MTGEHFWPVWSHALVDYGGKGRVRELHTHVVRIPVAKPVFRRKESPLHQFELRVVCGGCNTSWMSRIEEAAKPHLVPLILGENTIVSVAGQKAMAQWAAMKIMVVEHDHPENIVTPTADRRAMMDRGEVPSYFDVRIARHGMDTNIGFVRRTATLMREVDGRFVPPAADPIKNIQDISFIIGKLVFAIGASRANIGIGEMFGLHASLPRIWPAQEVPLIWPPPITLQQHNTQALGDRLDAWQKLNRVGWRQHPHSPIGLGGL